jgi:pilus assembly protein CpaE
MVILLVSDCQTRATRLRHILEQSGFECPLSNVVPIEGAMNAAATMQPNPALILFVVLSHDGERAQSAVRQLRDGLDTPVLAIGPRDSNLILGMLHAGANDYLDESGDLQSDLRSGLSRMFTASTKRSSGRLITVVGAGGGCGRTFAAANLAAVLAKTSGRCGLFDLDPIGADVATYLNLKPRHSIADLCLNLEKVDQKMFEQSLVEHSSGVSVLAAPE